MKETHVQPQHIFAYGSPAGPTTPISAPVSTSQIFPKSIGKSTRSRLLNSPETQALCGFNVVSSCQVVATNPSRAPAYARIAGL